MTIAKIARRLAPSNDLKALALWLTMAPEARACPSPTRRRWNSVTGRVNGPCFTLPRVALNAGAVGGIELDL